MSADAFLPEHLFLFLTAAVLLTISPGPDVVGTLSIGLSRGWKPAVGFGVGCGTGCLFHTVLAVFGVAALLQSSPVAFTALKWCGAAYLAWLGFGALRSRASRVGEFQGQDQALVRYFLKGLVANAINPKVAIFFLSFLPQFVVSSSIVSPSMQMLLLGGMFTIQAILVFAAIGLFSGKFGLLLQSRPGISVWLDRIAGSIFILLAVKLILPDTTSVS